MQTIEKGSTSYISGGILRKSIGAFYELIVGSIFTKFVFDDETLETLREYSSKGRIVYASLQSSTTSLVIFTNLLRKEGLPVPEFAVGFSPYFTQRIGSFIIRGVSRLVAVFSPERDRRVTDEELAADVISKGGCICLSFLSASLFMRRYVDIKTDNLQQLIEIQKKTKEPIYVFPQLLFWNRNPERSGAIAKLEPTGDMGFFAGLITTLKSLTPGFIRIPKPINLKEEIAKLSTRDVARVTSSIRSRILEIYNNEKRSVLGPIIKNRGEMMEKVLYHKNVLNEIKKLSSGRRGHEKKLRRSAFKYYNEIASDFSIVYIKVFDSILSTVFRKIFDGIQYNSDDFRKLREASQKAPLIIVPAHKSHMDYLIVSTLFYQNMLMPPHVHAGVNLSFFPMGLIFRKSGAYFVRRSFKGLDLYTMVFKQYLKTLISEGYSIEFFIEGGRTRTGRVLFPKIGVLKYLIDAQLEGYSRDLNFVPVSINYDRVLEEGSYDKELKGKEKNRETTGAFFKSRKLLKRNYGKVYVSFDDPISLADFKKKEKKGDELPAAFAEHITKRINEIAVVTPFAMTTAAILLSSSRGFSRKILDARLSMIYGYLKYCGAPMAESLAGNGAELKAAVDYVIKSFRDDGILKSLDVEIEASAREGRAEAEDVIVIDEEQRGRISFYRNTMIHYLLPPAFFSSAILKAEREGRMDIGSVSSIYSEIRELFAKEFIYSGVMDAAGGGFKEALNYFQSKGFLTVSRKKIKLNDGASPEIKGFAGIIRDSFESYYAAADTVSALKRGKTARKDVVIETRKNALKMYHLGRIKLAESLLTSGYEGCLDRLADIGILKETAPGRKNTEVSLANRKRAVEFRDRVVELMPDEHQ